MFRTVVRKDNVFPASSLSLATSSVRVQVSASAPGGPVNVTVTGASAYTKLKYLHLGREQEVVIPGAASGSVSFSAGSAALGTNHVDILFTNTASEASEHIRGTYTTANPTRRYDPIAQTFKVAERTFVKSVKLFFSQIPAVPTSTSPSLGNDFIYAYLTPVVNGYPAPYESAFAMTKKLTPSDLSGKTSSTALTAAEFEFETLVMLEANTSYALVVFTPSKDYRVYVGKIGGQLLTRVNPATGAIEAPSTATQKLNQSISDGVMFEGATKETWVAKPEYDLVFELVEVNEFKRSGVVTFSIDLANLKGYTPSADEKMVGFRIDASQVIVSENDLSSSNISWEYQLAGMASPKWISFQPGNYVFVEENITSSVNVRITFTSSDGKISSLLKKSSINVSGVFRKTSAVYQSNVATYDQEYSSVRMIGRMSIPELTSVSWYISDNTSVAKSDLPAWAAANSYTASTVVKHIVNDVTRYFIAKTAITGSASNLEPQISGTKVSQSWSSSPTYSAGTVVKYGSSLYLALLESSNKDPISETTFWKLVPQEWEEVEVEEFGRVWREIIPVTTALKPDSQGFKEYEQTASFPPSVNRKDFLFKIKCSAEISALTKPPRIRDIITIVNQ